MKTFKLIHFIAFMRAVLKRFNHPGISTSVKQYVRNIVLSGTASDINMLLPAQSGCIIYPFGCAASPLTCSDCMLPDTNPPLPSGAIQGYRHNDT